MIKHIVLFRVTGKINAEEKKTAASDLVSIFAPLGKLESVEEYRTAINFNVTESAWDVIIDSTFCSKKDLLDYQISQEHQDAIARARVIEKDKAIIDYEI